MTNKRYKRKSKTREWVNSDILCEGPATLEAYEKADKEKRERRQAEGAGEETLKGILLKYEAGLEALTKAISKMIDDADKDGGFGAPYKMILGKVDGARKEVSGALDFVEFMEKD